MENTEVDNKNANKPPKKIKILLIVFGILLSLSIITISLYFVLQNKYIEFVDGRPVIKEKVTSDGSVYDTDYSEEEENLETRDSDDQESQDYDIEKLTNPGWALFTVPHLGLSIETPGGLIKNDFAGIELQSKWSVSYIDKNPPEYMLKNDLGKFVGSMRASFFPVDTHDIACGGTGCLNTAGVGVYVYENDTNKSLEDAWEAISTNEYDGVFEHMNIKERFPKWGTEVINYNVSTVSGEYNGYLLLKNNNIYHVTYDIPSATDLSEIGNGVLDSLLIK